jgi:ribA/ribD-fused uncharacterized protein
MNHCAFFIKDKALFGSHPTQDRVKELEENGIKYFINLTCEGEKKIIPFTTQYTYISYPMQDHKAPKDWRSFAKLILYLSNIILNLKENDKIHINCKAGVGRSGVVVACLLCYIKKITPDEAIELTTKYHRERAIIKENIKKLTSPQTISQKNFVKKFFDKLYFYKAFKYGRTMGFSNFSLHQVEIPNVGIFPSAEASFQYFKNINDSEYVKKLLDSKTPSISKKLGKLFPEPENKYEIMEQILIYKFNQNLEIKENLLNTGLKTIISTDKNDKYFGIGIDNSGKNVLGILLMKIREKFYLEI